MNTRTIYYIDENEDFLNDEVVLALSRTLDQNYGHLRATNDLDIFINATEENARKMI